MIDRFAAYATPASNDSLLEELDISKNWFSSFGFLELLDLALVILILCALCLHLQSRRAGRMLLGGLFVVILLWGVRLIGFPILSAFASELFSMFLLVILILFHDELREVLRMIGCLPERIVSGVKRLWTRGHSRVSEKTAIMIDELCDAVAIMAEEHTGALIVLKRSCGVDEYTSKGKPLDAEVNSSLIRTVFYNGSPLHDGAMIIKKGRISAAGCQLPAADPGELDDSLGERHKAAIGISERTDAVVVVVSEETGIISVALGDKMKRQYRIEELREELTEFLGNYNTKLASWSDRDADARIATVRKQKKPPKEQSSAESGPVNPK